LILRTVLLPILDFLAQCTLIFNYGSGGLDLENDLYFSNIVSVFIVK
jgi:hypothetical protein